MSEIGTSLPGPRDPTETASLRRVLQKLGIDRAIGATVSNRVAQAGATLLLMAIVGSKMSLSQQGYYVTFNSVVALQVFFELGLTFVIMQFASHEAAHLKMGEDGVYSGARGPKARLSSLLRFGVQWYVAASVLLLAVVLPGGAVFFRDNARGDDTHFWLCPWFLLVTATAFTLVFNAVIAIFEGCGEVSAVATLRLRETLAGTAAAVILLLAGGGLYAVAALVVCDAAVQAHWLYRRRHVVADLWRAFDKDTVIRWNREIWPFQWKIGISWLSGYFIFQIINPILFACVGKDAAGRMGFTIQAFGGITSLAMAWISTKGPRMGHLASLGERRQLDALFFRATKMAVGLAATLAVAFWCVIVTMQRGHYAIAFRFLEPRSLALMMVASVATCLSFSQAAYLRAHKVEPFLIISIVAAVVNVLLALALAPRYGTLGAAAGYAFTTLVVGVGGGTLVFMHNRRRWSASPVSSPADGAA